MPKEQEQKGIVQALVKGLDVLEYFSSDGIELGINQLSELSGMPESSTQRVVNTLEYKGYLIQNPKTKKYRMALRYLLNEDRFSHMRLWKEVSREHLITLRNKTGETANLAIRVEDRLYYLDKVDSSHLLRPNFVVGEAYPLYCTAIGRCLLSDIPENTISLFLPETISKITDKTKTNLEDVKEQIISVKSRRYAIDDEEFQLGLCCIGSPVLAFNKRVVAAVSLSVPKARISTANYDLLIEWTVDTAEKIAEEYQKIFNDNQEVKV